jgi:para-nitrobenzyl esterase
VVETPLGALVGERARDGRTASFKGIRYALPPVGDGRWRPPVPAGPWTGPLQAKAFGPAAMQSISPPDGFYADAPASMSEDCLSLNIWAPTIADRAPVMIWIHGGNLVAGTASSPRYDGAALARLGVVVVTINYRLGIFGYFAHPELSAESSDSVSGNYGTLDQIQALRWVRDNIQAFGGDPANVTIFGQSAGALSVTHLMASPLAHGLFHRAIAQSAYLPANPALKTPVFGLPPAEATGRRFGHDAGAPSLAALRALSADSLLTTAARSGFVAEAVIDGWVQPAQIAQTFASGKQSKTPLMIGFAGGEARSFDGLGYLPSIPASPEDYEHVVTILYGNLSDRYLSQYPASDPTAGMYDAVRDGYFGHSVLKLAKDHAVASLAVYLYYFDHVYPSAAARRLGAFHSSDVPFVFGNVGLDAIAPARWPRPPHGPEDLALSQTMQAYWTAFARAGRADVLGRPAWAQFDESGAYMAFRGGRAVPSTGLLPGMFELFEDIIAMKRAAGVQWWKWSGIGLSIQEQAAPR